MMGISSRPETAFVLLMVQVSFWLLAALSALIFVVPMPAMGLYVALTAMAASAGLLLAAGLLERRRWARRWTVRLEAVCLAGSLLLLVVPLGTSRAPVALLCNVALPLALLWLLAGRRARLAFPGFHGGGMARAGISRPGPVEPGALRAPAAPADERCRPGDCDRPDRSHRDYEWPERVAR